MGSAPPGHWKSLCITHLATCPNQNSPTDSADEAARSPATSDDVVHFDRRGRLLFSGRENRERTVEWIASGAEPTAELIRSVGADPMREWGRHFPDSPTPRWIQEQAGSTGIPERAAPALYNIVPAGVYAAGGLPEAGRLVKWREAHVQINGGQGLVIRVGTERTEGLETRFTNLEARFTNFETRFTNFEVVMSELVGLLRGGDER